MVDGIFDDDVFDTAEPIAVRALYFDDGDSVVPANLPGGSTVLVVPAFCRLLQLRPLLWSMRVMELHLGQVHPWEQVQPWSQVRHWGPVHPWGQVQHWEQVQLWSQGRR